MDEAVVKFTDFISAMDVLIIFLSQTWCLFVPLVPSLFLLPFPGLRWRFLSQLLFFFFMLSFSKGLEEHLCEFIQCALILLLSVFIHQRFSNIVYLTCKVKESFLQMRTEF